MTHRLSAIKLESTEESHLSQTASPGKTGLPTLKHSLTVMLKNLPAEHSEADGEPYVFDEFLDSDITEDEVSK